jgi:hypothetical protein
MAREKKNKARATGKGFLDSPTGRFFRQSLDFTLHIFPRGILWELPQGITGERWRQAVWVSCFSSPVEEPYGSSL